MVEQQHYEIEITHPARKRYREEILNYILDNFSFERALKINDNITELVATLSTIPERGTLEQQLENYHQKFRFILHKETRNLEIKIIYYVNQSIKKVYVTDFFPVLMYPEKLKRRN